MDAKFGDSILSRQKGRADSPRGAAFYGCAID